MLVIALSLIAVVYIGFVALMQQDMKKLIADSSIAHMGLVTLGYLGLYAVVASTGKLAGAVLGVDGAWSRWSPTAWFQERCSCASGSCMTGCTVARSPATAAWSM